MSGTNCCTYKPSEEPPDAISKRRQQCSEAVEADFGTVGRWHLNRKVEAGQHALLHSGGE
jgi:hypothetical protein